MIEATSTSKDLMQSLRATRSPYALNLSAQVEIDKQWGTLD
jgi:hypothetical protein